MNLGFAISLWIIDRIIHNPKVINVRIDIGTSDDADTDDDLLGVATSLPMGRFDLEAISFISHRIIEQQISIVWVMVFATLSQTCLGEIRLPRR